MLFGCGAFRFVIIAVEAIIVGPADFNVWLFEAGSSSDAIPALLPAGFVLAHRLPNGSA